MDDSNTPTEEELAPPVTGIEISGNDPLVVEKEHIQRWHALVERHTGITPAWTAKTKDGFTYTFANVNQFLDHLQESDNPWVEVECNAYDSNTLGYAEVTLHSHDDEDPDSVPSWKAELQGAPQERSLHFRSEAIAIIDAQKQQAWLLRPEHHNKVAGTTCVIIGVAAFILREKWSGQDDVSVALVHSILVGLVIGVVLMGAWQQLLFSRFPKVSFNWGQAGIKHKQARGLALWVAQAALVSLPVGLFLNVVTTWVMG